MRPVIMAVGGSGQMVLHHYVQQFLIGTVQQPFDAWVLDTDRCVESLNWLSRFFSDVSSAMGAAEARARVPAIRFVPLKTEGVSGTLAELLTQQAIPSQPGFHHPAQAFFSRDALSQDVTEGLYARPALSAVVAVEKALEQIKPEQFEQNSKVVLLTSCIGGTGGGLSIPLLWRLEHTPDRNLQLHAVLLGDYFKTGQQAMVGNDVRRFRSNRLAFLKALRESLRELRAYAFIEQPQMQSRDSKAEQAARNLPWAESDTPYWRGAAATEHLLRQAIQAVGGFRENEVAPATYTPTLKREQCWQDLARSIGRVDALISKRVLSRMANEAPVEAVWGKALPDCLASYWRLLRSSEGGSLAPNDFLKSVERAAADLWRDSRQGYSLSLLFPACTAQPATVDDIRHTGWPAAPDALPPEDFKGRETAIRRVAALLLFSALHYGK